MASRAYAKKWTMMVNRVQREIVEYVSLSQSVIQLTKIVSVGMTHVKKVSDAPNIAKEANA
jgi:hypothetical protein